MGGPYEQHEFTIGNVIGEAFGLYRQFFLRFLSLALIVFGTVDLVAALSTTASSDAGKALWILVGLVAALVGFFWLQGALVVQTEDVRDGRIDTSIGVVFGRTQDRLPALIGAGLVVGAVLGVVFVVLTLLLSVVGFFLALLIALFLASRWFVTTPVIVLERVGPIAGLRRSYELVRGHSWRAFWLVLVTAIITGIVSSIIAAIVRGIFSGFLEAWLGSLLANAVTVPFLGLAWTLAYYHLRAMPESELPAGAAFSE